MNEQGTLDSYNECHNILDFDDSDVLISNNFETHSFKENNNAKNGEMQSNYYGQIERLSNEKLLIQNQCNSKVIDLQAQIMKLTNNFERVETAKTELEVELTKCHKDLRQTQRNLQIKSNELEHLKIEFNNKINSMESDYLNKIAYSNNLNKSLQDQICEEKRNNKNNQDFLSDKINQMFNKIKEKEDELTKNIFNQNNLQKSIGDLEQKINELTIKIDEYEKVNVENSKELQEKNEKIDTLKNSESKLKILVSELTRKITLFESKMFEEKHELNESKSYQNNLQAQLLDLQQTQITKEKEYNILVDKVCNSNKKIKELEEALNNQMQISSNYHEHLKKFENKHKAQSIDIKDQNENLFKKVAQLEETIKIQSRIIEETNEELSTSRECEGVAVSNLNFTLEELDKLIEEPKVNLKSPLKTSHFNTSPKIVTEFYNDSFISPSNSCVVPKSGDNNFSPTPNKRIIRNVKQIIRDFQERISSLDNDKLEGIDKIQAQDKEIKNLKVQVRKYITQNKTLEIDNAEKQHDIENLHEEISKLKSIVASMKLENSKSRNIYKENVDNLKNSISRVSEESQNNIESRDKYLQNLSVMIKEALQNSLSSCMDWPKLYGKNLNFSKINMDKMINESATQTNFNENFTKENLELTGNMTGTFCFSNQINPSSTEMISKPIEKRSHIYDKTREKKIDTRTIVINDDRKKSKKIIKLPEKNKEAYVDSAQSWPALREVISNELSSLLNRYDLQRAQCHNLLTELSTKENLISRLLSYQNSNSFNNQGNMESFSQNPHENIDEIAASTNKVVCKGGFSNQSNQNRNNMDSKKRTKLLLKSRVDNMSNSAGKRCNKLENQKQCTSIPMNPTGKPVPTNKKATIISTKMPEKSIGDQSNSNSKIQRMKLSTNNLCVTKQITISLPSMPQVTLKCPKIVDKSCQIDELIIDNRLISLFLGAFINLIHLRSEMETKQSLIKFYKLLYHRSVDCSKLIFINEHLESLINHSYNHSKVIIESRKIKKLKIFAHVVMVCIYLSKRMLASKLMIHINSEVIISNNIYQDFIYNAIHNVPNSLNINIVSKKNIESIINDFVQFCSDHNNNHLLIMNSSKKSENNFFTYSNAIVFDKLKSNIDTIQTLMETHKSKAYYKSKYKLYQHDIQTLIEKIKEMGKIIDDQNSLINIREHSMNQHEEKISLQTQEISRLNDSMKQYENLYQRQNREIDKLKSIINKTKAYLVPTISICEEYSKCDIFNFEQLVEEEESIYNNLVLDDCDDFINFVRDGIRVALRLSCSVKSIFI